MKTFKKIMAAMMAMIMMTGCSNSNTVKYDQTFDTKNYKDFITIGNDVNSFNYLASHLAVNLVLAQNLNDGLVETDKYGNIVGQLATDWKTDDYQTWTFNLKKGVKWSDSEGNVVGEVKADDFVYAIETGCDKETPIEIYKDRAKQHLMLLKKKVEELHNIE